MQALLAQAVAARSYAIAQTRYRYDGPAGNRLSTIPSSTCDTQACQVYRGAALLKWSIEKRHPPKLGIGGE